MTRKALLIGSQTGRLTGVDNDIKAMAAALGLWGFAITRCVGANASRAGILDAYERLIAAAGPDDTVVVYYSGHGGYTRRREAGRRADTALQFIVPTDIGDSSEGDFRGILSAELSVLLARLTRRTRNATVILDCCHAAHMSRDDERHLVAKGQSRPVSYDVLVRHADELQRRQKDFDLWSPPGNPWAVRIVACAPEQSAYEWSNEDGLRIGIMTEALTDALTEAHAGGVPVSWSTLVDEVRERVLRYVSIQRPEAEGPAQRLLFETAEADMVASLPVTESGGRVTLGGASLLGVRVNDEFAIMPADCAGPDDDAKLGDVAIDELRGAAASGPLRLHKPGTPVPLGARAYQTRATAAAMPVRLPRNGATGAALDAAIAGIPILRVAEPDEPCPVEVRAVGAGAVAIWDRVGPLHPPREADPAGLDEVVRNLKRLAWANSLRCLDDDPAHALDNPIEVEFGLAADGEEEPLRTSGAVLYVGQRIYLRVRNRGDTRVYVSLIDIGVSSKISILNTATPAGVPVEPGGEYTFGWNALTKVMQGSELSWPPGLVRALPRPETVVVLVSSEQQNIRGLEQPAVHGAAERGGPADPRGPRSSLERLLDQIDHGGTREIAPEDAPSVRYRVRTVDFELVPSPPPVAEDPEFQVDDRPELSVLLWSPKSTRPRNVSVRLSGLLAHHHRTFRGADIRLDTLVLTGGPDKEPSYVAETARFHGIRDGETLPSCDMRVFQGPALDYLDIAVWVSRDTSGGLPLADLMQEKLTRPDVKLAMGQADGTLIGAPQAATAVAAAGASAVLINAAYHVLTGIVGHPVGLYRTTMLAGEQFGIGRPADQHTVHAEDFSFRCLIEDVR